MNTQYLKLADGAIAYDDQGEGPLVLCIPAGGDLRSEYRFLTPQLVAAGYRVVTMDLRGQGESSAVWPDYSPSAIGADMLALIKKLNVGPAFLLATSVAPAGAIWASVEAPELVRGMVLISGTSHAGSPFQSTLIPLLLLNQLWGKQAYIGYFPKMYPLSRPADFDAHLASVKAMLSEPGRLRSLRLLFTDAYKDWDDRVAQVKAPVLIINGSRDPDFKNPELEAQTLANRLKSSSANSSRVKVQMIEGAGHHPQTEVPDQTGRAIIDFLASIR